MSDTRYFIIVDTEDYAGSFERELCAYMTGTIGDCGVGKSYQELFLDEESEEAFDWFEENVIYLPDDHGCRRPVKLSATPGWFNDGVGNHHREDDHDPKEVVRKYNSSSGIRAMINSMDEIHKYPAYQSIEIGFYEKPSNMLLQLMVNRANEFCNEAKLKSCHPPSKITAVRFVERTTTVEDKELFRK